MAIVNYAFIKNGEVVNTALFDDPTTETLNFFKDQYSLDEIVLAGENAEIGSTYDGEKFCLPKPFPSWIKNEETNEWEAPEGWTLENELNSKE